MTACRLFALASALQWAVAMLPGPRLRDASWGRAAVAPDGSVAVSTVQLRARGDNAGCSTGSVRLCGKEAQIRKVGEWLPIVRDGFATNSHGADALCRALGYASGAVDAAVTADLAGFTTDGLRLGACPAGATFNDSSMPCTAGPTYPAAHGSRAFVTCNGGTPGVPRVDGCDPDMADCVPLGDRGRCSDTDGEGMTFSCPGGMAVNTSGVAGFEGWLMQEGKTTGVSKVEDSADPPADHNDESKLTDNHCQTGYVETSSYSPYKEGNSGPNINVALDAVYSIQKFKVAFGWGHVCGGADGTGQGNATKCSIVVTNSGTGTSAVCKVFDTDNYDNSSLVRYRINEIACDRPMAGDQVSFNLGTGKGHFKICEFDVYGPLASVAAADCCLGTCADTDGVGTAFSCPGSQIADAGSSGSTNLSAASCCNPVCGDIDGNGTAFACPGSMLPAVGVAGSLASVAACCSGTCADLNGQAAPFSCPAGQAIRAENANSTLLDVATCCAGDCSTFACPTGYLTLQTTSDKLDAVSCCRRATCADTDGAATPFACPAGLVANTCSGNSTALTAATCCLSTVDPCTSFYGCCMSNAAVAKCNAHGSNCPAGAPCDAAACTTGYALKPNAASLFCAGSACTTGDQGTCCDRAGNAAWVTSTGRTCDVADLDLSTGTCSGAFSYHPMLVTRNDDSFLRPNGTEQTHIDVPSSCGNSSAEKCTCQEACELLEPPDACPEQSCAVVTQTEDGWCHFFTTAGCVEVAGEPGDTLWRRAPATAAPSTDDPAAAGASAWARVRHGDADGYCSPSGTMPGGLFLAADEADGDMSVPDCKAYCVATTGCQSISRSAVECKLHAHACNVSAGTAVAGYETFNFRPWEPRRANGADGYCSEGGAIASFANLSLVDCQARCVNNPICMSLSRSATVCSLYSHMCSVTVNTTAGGFETLNYLLREAPGGGGDTTAMTWAKAQYAGADGACAASPGDPAAVYTGAEDPDGDVSLDDCMAFCAARPGCLAFSRSAAECKLYDHACTVPSAVAGTETFNLQSGGGASETTTAEPTVTAAS